MQQELTDTNAKDIEVRERKRAGFSGSIYVILAPFIQINSVLHLGSSSEPKVEFALYLEPS